MTKRDDYSDKTYFSNPRTFLPRTFYQPPRDQQTPLLKYTAKTRIQDSPVDHIKRRKMLRG